jgi:hypothetical protein
MAVWLPITTARQRLRERNGAGEFAQRTWNYVTKLVNASRALKLEFLSRAQGLSDWQQRAVCFEA